LTNVKSSVNLEDIVEEEELARTEYRRYVVSHMLLQQEGRPLVPSTHSLRYAWFAVRVRSNHERLAAAHLRERGYEEFLPSYKTERRWSDRKKEIVQFLFPGYVFCRLNPVDRLPVLTAPGVIDLVGFGRVPSPVPDSEIEAIRRMVQSGLLVMPWPFLELGNRVLIERGPLAGVEGILDEVKGRCRLVVSVNLLQRSVSAEVDRNWVRPLPPVRSERSAIAPARSTRIA
jgi:transcription antitermination factor NusG